MHGIKGSGGGFEPKNGLAWWYQRLAQYMVANPNQTKKDIAKQFDCTPQTVYLITNSETFKTYYAQLMENEEQALTGIAEKTAAVTEMALDHLIDNLAAPGANETIPTMQLQEIAQKGLTALGYGAKSPSIQINGGAVIGNVQVHRDELAAARERYAQTFGDEAAKALVAPSPGGHSSAASKMIEHIPEAVD